MPDRPWVLLPAGRRLAIPTKTRLSLSQCSGRLDSSDRVPLHVLSTSFSGRAPHWYLFQQVRMRSRSSLSFKVASGFLRSGGFVLCFRVVVEESLTAGFP